MNSNISLHTSRCHQGNSVHSVTDNKMCKAQHYVYLWGKHFFLLCCLATLWDSVKVFCVTSGLWKPPFIQLHQYDLEIWSIIWTNCATWMFGVCFSIIGILFITSTIPWESLCDERTYKWANKKLQAVVCLWIVWCSSFNHTEPSACLCTHVLHWLSICMHSKCYLN